MIYFVQPIDGGTVKIGFSSDVETRLAQLEKYYGKPLAILATMPGGRAEEQAIHRRFAHLRLGRTEQFQPAGELMSFIDRPLFVSQGDVELMEPTERITIINLKGTEDQAAWLEAIHRKTHIAKSVIMRLALDLWAQQNGHPPFPKSEDDL